jgi:uncharacterized membrane protein
MNKIEKIIKEYSSKKLLEIIEQQSNSYSMNFIDYAKDELIRRGESFPFNTETEKEVAAMSDTDLKNLIEKEWNNFHLEYLEIARKEYLKRKFINETSDENQDDEQKGIVVKKYHALRTIAVINSVFAWIIGIVAVIIAIYYYSQNQTMGLTIGIPSLIIGALIVLELLAVSESIRVFIDIEENTRKTNG